MICKCIGLGLLQCFFNITPSPVIAVLAGGSEQTVSDTSQLILDATGSRDPDEPPGVRDHLIFSWSCSPNTSDLCKDISMFRGKLV